MLPKFILRGKHACIRGEKPLSFDELMQAVINSNERIDAGYDPFSLLSKDPSDSTTPPDKPKQPVPQEEPDNPPVPEKPRQPVPQEEPRRPGAPEYPKQPIPPDHPK